MAHIYNSSKNFGSNMPTNSYVDQFQPGDQSPVSFSCPHWMAFPETL